MSVAAKFTCCTSLSLIIGLATSAVAGSADIEGTVRYQTNGNRITVEIERIINNTSRTTGTLYVTVQMTPGPTVTDRGGHRVARGDLREIGSRNGQLRPGYRFTNVRLTMNYTAPPAGTYYVHFYTSEYPNRDTVLDSYRFPSTITIGGGGGGSGGSADIEGTVRYQTNGNRITVEIERIINNTSRTTGTLYVTVQMTPGPTVTDRGGHRVARGDLREIGSRNGQLRPGYRFTNVRLTMNYTAPPAGTYYVHFYTSEYPNRDTVLDSYRFPSTITIGGGGGGRPDLVVESPSVSDTSLTPRQSFRLSATVRNRGSGTSERTTLRYYRSDDRTISTSDREVGDDRVGSLDASETNNESIPLYAPTTPGTYYYGACVDRVSGESNRSNNCSSGVRVVVSGGPGTPGTPPTDDHPNRREEVRSTTRLNTATRGVLERSGDVDYFRVEVTQTGQLRIAASGSTDTDGNLQTSRSWLAADDTDGEGNNFRIERQVTRGTYYIAVFGGRGRSATGAYTLHVSFRPGGGGPAPSDDHGNRREAATRVGPGTATRGALERQGDVDYFRVDVPANGQLRVTTSGATYTFGYVGTAARWLAQDDNAGEGNNFRIEQQVTRGTYYIAVFGERGRTATGSYTLHVGFTPSGGGGPSDIREHGDSREQATVVRLDATLPVNVRGALERPNDRDYFRVIVPATGELRVATSGNTDTFGYLGGTSGGWLSQNDDNRGNLNFRIVRRVSRGTYYVAVVGGEGRTATGEYTLHVNFSRQ